MTTTAPTIPADLVAPPASPTTISGTVQRVNFAKPTWSAGTLYDGSRAIKFSVKAFIKHGQPLTLAGQWEDHPKWGRQFVADEIVYTMPATYEGIVSWLRTYAYGIGPAKAKQAVEVFGLEFPRLLTENPQQITAELGITLESVNMVAEKWVKSASEVNAMGELLAFGLTANEAERIYHKYTGQSVDIVRENPYQLLGQVEGFGWATVDAIGAKCGIAPNDQRRVEGGILETLRKQLGEGSTAMPAVNALDTAKTLLGATVGTQPLAAAADKLVNDGRVRIVGADTYALPGVAEIETRLHAKFRELSGPNPFLVSIKILDQYRTFNYRGSQVTLDDSQLAALGTASAHRGCVITGGAGSGKTLLAKAIHRLYDLENADIALCAPTGKAARRLAQVIGHEATTVHRLLGYMGGAFTHNEKNVLDYDLVICDEVSMLDSALCWSLLSACGPRTAVVMIGDPNQLPPVGPGYPLRDILDLNLVPSIRLNHCHRQAGPLAASCVGVLAGRLDATDVSQEPPGWVYQPNLATPAAVTEAIKFLVDGNAHHPPKLAEWGYGDLFAHQFMTSMHKGELGIGSINELLQRLYQAKRGVTVPTRDPDARLPLMIGDKVIQTANDYELGVMNGTLGRVQFDDPFIVEFEDYGAKSGWRSVQIPGDKKGNVSLAYCTSVHKYQGSQVPCAIFVCTNKHSFMNHRNLVYTAVTRAQKTAIVMGDQTGCSRAMSRVEVSARRTVLQYLAKEERSGNA